MKQLTILGSTGSIGCSTLDVVRHNPEHFRVVALVAGKNVTRMVEQCLEFSPRYAVMDDEASAKLLKTMLQQQGSRTEVLSGQQAACDMAALEDVDQVMAAIVGAAGLLPTLAAIRAGKTILLANKESLVTCGRLFMDAVKQSKAQLLPVDSEHNAIFQSLPQPIQHNLGYADLEQNGVVSILLTGAGGPFRETPLRDLATMTPDQACRHPNWSMGRKISVDSATMMNKGLEVIEARWLFDVPADQIQVLVHPQSILHSAVEFADNSVIGQMGVPDMRIPISLALGYPERLENPDAPLDFFGAGSCLTFEKPDLETFTCLGLAYAALQTGGSCLTFAQPDMDTFRCLALAYDAIQTGGSCPLVLNAANEVLVDAFLHEAVRFTDIPQKLEQLLSRHTPTYHLDLEGILELDRQTRTKTRELL